MCVSPSCLEMIAGNWLRLSAPVSVYICICLQAYTCIAGLWLGQTIKSKRSSHLFKEGSVGFVSLQTSQLCKMIPPLHSITAKWIVLYAMSRNFKKKKNKCSLIFSAVLTPTFEFSGHHPMSHFTFLIHSWALFYQRGENPFNYISHCNSDVEEMMCGF